MPNKAYKNMTGPQPRRGIAKITPYVAGKSSLPEIANPVRLASNESAFGPSPNAIAAYRAVETQLHRYPDAHQAELKRAIAEVHGLEEDRIVCGNGSDELIGLLTRAYVGRGDELLISENHFVMCPIYGMVQGAKIVMAPEKNFCIDVDAILDRVTPKTRMVSIANPNNPTGTYIPREDVDRLSASLPPDVLLVLDCAYAEYVTVPEYDPGVELVRNSANVVMTRTFSKMYGLAGLRIGWAYGPTAVIEIIQRIRSPFNTTSAGMAAAAAAVQDTAYIERIREHNARWLARISDELSELGLSVVPSVANFYLIDFRACPAGSARGAVAYLEQRGIIPRPVSTGAQEHVLRITVGLDEENEAVLAALRNYLSGAAANPDANPQVDVSKEPQRS